MYLFINVEFLLPQPVYKYVQALCFLWRESNGVSVRYVVCTRTIIQECWPYVSLVLHWVMERVL